MIVGFLGMTHLGINYAIASAEKGFNVVCFDFDKKKIDNLKKNKTFFFEPGLSFLLKKNKKKILFTDNIKDINQCKLVFLSQDVPTNSKNESNLSFVEKLIKKSIPFLDKKACFVILSQVHPGFTRGINWEKNKLYYQVETLVFGNALNRIFKAERIIIGSFSTSKNINKYYRNFLRKFNCPLVHLNYESAELAKISINMFLITQVCTANLLASICEKIGADWQSIIPALMLDRRIGLHAYINPGLGLSGGNLERDLKTLISLNKTHCVKDKMLKSILYNSNVNKNWVIKKISTIKINKKKDAIAILGLAYKENTSSIKNSPSLSLINKLRDYKLFVYDSKIKQTDIKKLNIAFRQSINEILENAEILIIMNRSTEFKKITLNLLKKKFKGNHIFDPMGVLMHLNLKKSGYNYHVIGRFEN
jgi:UDPglucose 6-dehydrogenase